MELIFISLYLRKLFVPNKTFFPKTRRHNLLGVSNRQLDPELSWEGIIETDCFRDSSRFHFKPLIHLPKRSNPFSSFGIEVAKQSRR